VKIRILYDNRTIKSNILAGWGFSCLVGDSVLFDTGEDWERLSQNMGAMGIVASRVEDVVISHDHWDHTGGLEGMLKVREGLRVYGCPGFGAEFKKRVNGLGGQLVESKDPAEIKKNIFVTGTIHGEHRGRYIEEQAAAIKTPKGVTVITGCAHPGVVKIVEAVKDRFRDENIYSVVGGFHLKDASENDIIKVAAALRDLGVEKVGPAHCTGEEALGIFKKSFGGEYITIAAGMEHEV
jgi:7,8-dihydropterin-6-yl-methyl-4-(beta-D-ribofuranosyl)aminobenzene 5'-phosphate synthase